jgi:hypothetical protein
MGLNTLMAQARQEVTRATTNVQDSVSAFHPGKAQAAFTEGCFPAERQIKDEVDQVV